MDKELFEVEVELEETKTNESENKDGSTIIEEDDGYCD